MHTDEPRGPSPATCADALPTTLEALALARLLVLAEPLRPREQAMAARAASALERYLGLAPAAAEAEGRRSVLLRRERLFHDLLLLRGEASLLAAVLDTVAVEGAAHLATLPANRGTLFLTLHFSLYTSVLWEWLARETARGRFCHFTSLLIASVQGSPEWMAAREAELAAVGLVAPGTCTVVDRGARGEIGAARALVQSLRAGGAALVAPDVGFLPPDAPHALPVGLGRERIGLPRGVAWLAERAGCTVVPIHVWPDGAHGHALVVGQPRPPAASGGAAAVRAALQELLDGAVYAQPAAWEEWSRVEWAGAGLPKAESPPDSPPPTAGGGTLAPYPSD